MRATDADQTMAEIAMLYELALAVSTSLDFDACCEQFITTLMARKNLSYASVWTHTPDAGCCLRYALPELHTDSRCMAPDHPVLTRVQEGAYTVRDADPGFAEICTEARISEGTYAVMPLGSLGVLKLHALSGGTRLDALVLRQLAPVVAKFTASLRACVSHAAMLEAVEAQRVLEQRLAQAARLESLGKLAGGVAHDFNNIISAISAYSELLILDPDDPARVENYSQRTLSACDRAADLTRQLLDFGHAGETSFGLVDLNAVLVEVGQLLEYTLDNGVEVSVLPSAGPATVMGDASRLHSMILNLALNGADAQPGGGSLEISVRSARGAHIIEVVDHGIGMDPQTLERVFDPFFTTKPQGRGTGLGLATVYGTVQAHGGTIEVESEVGRGSRFVVRLPRTEGMRGPSVPPAAILRGVEGLRVLVVDDEELPRQAAVEMLRQLGCVPTDAPNGAAALLLYQRPGSFDLVLLDLMMPDMDGAELLRQLRKVDPGVQALMASAFGHAGLMDDLQRLGPDGYLQKPYRLRALTRELTRLVAALDS